MNSYDFIWIGGCVVLVVLMVLSFVVLFKPEILDKKK